MRFTPDRVDVNQGDIVKLVVVNDGKLLHVAAATGGAYKAPKE